jgi:hypothetical protein
MPRLPAAASQSLTLALSVYSLLQLSSLRLQLATDYSRSVTPPRPASRAYTVSAHPPPASVDPAYPHHPTGGGKGFDAQLPPTSCMRRDVGWRRCRPPESLR